MLSDVILWKLNPDATYKVIIYSWTEGGGFILFFFFL